MEVLVWLTAALYAIIILAPLYLIALDFFSYHEPPERRVPKPRPAPEPRPESEEERWTRIAEENGEGDRVVIFDLKK